MEWGDIVRVSVDFEWAVQGHVRLDEGQKLVFPSLPADPGLYRFRFISARGETAYIGESDNLQQRMMHYRNPGPTQATNIRLNQLMREAIGNGNDVEIAIATDIVLQLNGRSVGLNLRHRGTRRLLENAALVAAEIAGESSHNL